MTKENKKSNKENKLSNKVLHGKIIFGIKIRHLRTERGLSFADLAEKTGMSLSYLNEIEKGKKYPKDDKIIILANALGTTPEDLMSAELPASLAPVEDLLQSNFLNELPLHLFGIDLAKVVEIIAAAPLRVGAFISTLLDLSRNYALREENFYFGALRSYLELNNNYFEDLEEGVRKFIKENKVPTGHALPAHFLANMLERKFGYKIIENGFANMPNLQRLRSLFVPKTKQLLLNGNLTEEQKIFQFGKELGFNILNLKERAYTSSLLRVQSFEETLNHYKAGYFSVALSIQRDSFVKEVEQWLKRDKWNGDTLLRMLIKYNATPETLYQRLTNILPRFFGLEKLFFLRVIQNRKTGVFDLNKELHLNRKHHPHRNSLHEHYCRRWVSVTILQDLEKLALTEGGQNANLLVGIQRSKYFNTNDEYLCFTIARRTETQNVSVTIGILIDQEAKQQIKFLADESLPIREVSTTCERCAVRDCAERATEPIIVYKKYERQQMQEALKKLLG